MKNNMNPKSNSGFILIDFKISNEPNRSGFKNGTTSVPAIPNRLSIREYPQLKIIDPAMTRSNRTGVTNES